jgi:DNA helicase IV
VPAHVHDQHTPGTGTGITGTATDPEPDPGAGGARGAGPEAAAQTGAGDPLARERAHLAESRAALRSMRKAAEALDIRDVAANWVNAQVLAAQQEARVKELAELAHTPLFFGRLDYLPPEHEGHSFHIGRRHVHDAHGDPMVVDWRAPVSQAFYRASRKETFGVGLRRRFGYTGGELTAYEDERLTGADDGPDGDPAGGGQAGRLLRQEIERPRVGPMRDIVATIQPEQDEIVRLSPSGTVCVQGGPGTGKTAVGLHRVAYLLYAHRERLARTGTLVIGPNRSFLHYIEQVLPALGELEVKQATVDELVAHVEVRGADTPATAALKGDARMAAVLRRALYGQVVMPGEALTVVRGSRRWRVPAYELEELVRELLDRDIRYGAARDALPQRIAHAVLVRMEQAGEAPDDRVQDAVARNPAVKAVVKAAWPEADPVKLVLRLLSDAEFLARHAEGILDAAEQRALRWERPPRSARSARWSAADSVLIDEAADLVRRTSSLGHVVLDEAQDLSPMQYRAVGRRCTTGSATVLGDLAQGTTPWATETWADALAHLGKPEAAVEELTAGFRVPREVIAYASRLLPHMSPGLAAVTSVREAPGSLELRAVDGADPAGSADGADPAGSGRSARDGSAALDAAVVAACRDALRREGSVGLIAADPRIGALAAALDAAGLAYLEPGAVTTAEARLTLVPASLVKGLEYDQVVLDEPAAVVAAEPDGRTGLRRLYVALTRAVSGLVVVHREPLPAQLG